MEESAPVVKVADVQADPAIKVPSVEPKKKAVVRRATARAIKKAEAENAPVSEHLLFGKYSLKDVIVNDQSLANQILLVQRPFPNNFGRKEGASYLSTHISIVERLVNKLMRGGTGQKIGGRVIRTKGRLQGKKIKVMHIVERAFEVINKKSGKNPAQMLVNALEHSAPMEDTTRIRYGGINYPVSVGVSASRRLDIALRNIALAALIGAFKNKRSLSESLADEIILAANKDPASYSIKRKGEQERIARSAR